MEEGMGLNADAVSPTRRMRWLAAAVLGLALGAQPAQAPHAAAQEPAALPDPLVYLRDIDPSILQDIRYAGPDNFTGRRVTGYGAGECVLLREVADALSRVQQDLAAQKLSLKVYDCYRPLRAVRAFIAWVERDDFDPLLKRYHPRIERSRLISLGYIAAASRHSRGDAVDLTLVRLPAAQAPASSRDKAYADCTGPAEARAPDNSVDMGTSFDCLDPLSHTDTTGITPAQRRWRQTLVEAMRQQGFRNYRKEWWHFEFMPAHSQPAFSVPVLPRQP
jgi:zinc D-Ala-D-Ala dipeptidase